MGCRVKFRIALVLTAAAVAFWITQSWRSFLATFLVTLALLVISVGIGLAIHVGTAPTLTEADLDRIEFEEYLKALDRTTDWEGQ